MTNPRALFRAGYFVPNREVPVRFHSTKPMITAVCERYGKYDPQGRVTTFGPTFSDSLSEVLKFLRATMGSTRLAVICGEANVGPVYWRNGVLPYVGPSTFVVVVASGTLYSRLGYEELAHESPYFDFVSNRRLLGDPNSTAKIDNWFNGATTPHYPGTASW